MLYAIVSDIHANLNAWNAVLADLATLKAKKIICLGDVVGYGPEPAEVLKSVYKHIDAFVMGNHDAVVSGKMRPDNFNSHAREMIIWSRGKISESGRKFLGEQPLVLSAPDFVCVHGSLDRPQAFNYILTPEEALDTWQATDEQLVFVGHSHIPTIFVLGHSGTPHIIDPQDFEIEDGKRYIVNVGSVGDPRDDDPRASYCLYDDKTKTVTFRRIPFDYEAVRKAVRGAGLDATAIPLLKRDPVPKREAVRDTLEFAPPKKDTDMANDVAISGYIGTLKKTNSLLRILTSTALISLMTIAGVATALFVNRDKATVAYPEQPLAVREAIVPSDIVGNLLYDFPMPPFPENSLMANWRYKLEDSKLQHVDLLTDENTGRAVLGIRNDRRQSLIIEAADWMFNGIADGRVRIIINSRCSSDFSGNATIRVIANAGMPDERTLISKPLALKRSDKWIETKQIMDSKKPRIDKNVQRISYSIQADFTGTIYLTEPIMLFVE